MTCAEIIERLDTLEFNQFDMEQKLRWIHQLDGQIYREVIERHEGAPDMPPLYKSGKEKPMIQEPYGEQIYTSYLLAQMALYYGEGARYNSQAAAFDRAYMAWSADYTRRHMPKGAKQFIF